MSDVEISKMLLKINKKYPQDIEEHFGARNIIDQQFEDKTLSYFYFQMFIYIFGFVIPITLQMFTFVNNSYWIKACMITCLASQAFTLLCEIVKMKGLGTEYFLEFYHYIEIAHIAIFIVYFWLRLFFEKSMLPEDYVHKVGDNNVVDENLMKEDGATYTNLMYFSIFNCFLYASVGLKCMSFMRIQPKLGQLELLIGQCLWDCIPFAIFYMAWTYLFARFNEILGVNSEHSQFVDLDKVFRYYF